MKVKLQTLKKAIKWCQETDNGHLTIKEGIEAFIQHEQMLAAELRSSIDPEEF